MMTIINEKHQTFPEGLPDNLLQKNESGAIQLFSLLQLSHNMRRAISRNLSKNHRSKKLPERDHLIRYYSEPDTRFKLFDESLQHQGSEEKPVGYVSLSGKSYRTHAVAIKQLDTPILIPSLEYQILSHYRPNFLEASYQEEKLASHITAWEEVGQTIESFDDNLKKSVMVWLTAQQDLDNWSALAAEQRIELANVVFAVATIAKSASLISQAIGQVPELESFYSELFTNAAESTEKAAEEIVIATDSDSLEPDWNPNQKTTDSLSVEQQWKTLCSDIIATAQQALEKPSIEFIDTIQAFSTQLEGLRDQIPVKEQALDIFNDQLDKLSAYLVKFSQQESVDLQQLDNLLSRWYLAAYQPDTVEDINRVTQDINRVFSEVAPLAAEEQILFQQFSQNYQQFSQLMAKSSSSLDEQLAVTAKMTHINEQRVQLRTEILNQASPFQQTFDSETDYLTEWLTLTGLLQPEPKTHPVLVGTSADETAPSEALEVSHSTTSDGLKPATENDVEDTKPDTEPDETEDIAAATPVESSPSVTPSKPAATVETAEPSTVQPEKTAIVEQFHQQITKVKILTHSLSIKEPDEALKDKAAVVAEIQRQITATKILVSSLAAEEPQQIARLVATSQPNTTEHLEWLNALVWRLITDNRIGLAYHIAQCVENRYSKEQCAVPAIMLKALALSHLVQSSLGEVIVELRTDIPQITSFFQTTAQQAPNRISYNLLGFALVLRPALLAPMTTGASDLLSQLSLTEGFQALYDLCQAILEYTGLGLALTPDILKGVGEQARWSNSLQSLQSEAREWLNRNRQANFKYGRTTHVWTRWLQPEQSLGQMLSAVIQDERHKQSEVEQIINEFSSADKVHKLLHQTDREIRGRKADVRPIDKAAKTAIYQHVQNALQLAQDWLNLLQNEPQPVNRFIHEQVNNCRTKIISCLQQSQTQLQELLQQHSAHLELAASVAAAHRALQDLHALFDPQQTESSASWQLVLHAELLRIPRLQLDETWQRPANLSYQKFLASLINLLQTEQSIDWHQAFDNQCDVGNHFATQHLIDFLKEKQRRKTPDKSLEKRRENHLVACRHTLETDIKETREKIERATVEGGLTETERLNWLSALDKMVPADIIDFQPSFNAIKDIVKQLKNTKNKQIQKLHYELQETASPIKRDDSKRIKAALDKGDVLIANEYLAMAKAGSSLPENENTRDAFSEFFPQFVDKLIKVLGQERKDPTRNVKDIEMGNGFYPLNMRSVPGAQAKTAAKMLQAWLVVQNKMGHNPIEPLRDILDGLGFQNSDFTRQDDSSTDRHRWFEMRVRPIKDRNTCVIPTFCSTAQGYYRLLCLWERPSEEEILSLTARQARETPIIVFYFGWLTTKRRRDLAYLCRDERRTLLVVDETLIYFLCGERGLRLPILFQCAFPFTVENPFTTTGSNVPVEMFFGRKGQRESIFDRFGTNLIYGGRQLGKTALLREVKRQSHNPNDGIIVLWIDLKAENIGMSRPPEEIWLVIAQALQAEGILSSSVRQPDTISTQIQEWLNVHPQRRILLLLDEADGFLSQDASDDNHSGNSFQTLTRLKNLMETTERHFKVVFAGLHNVQRTARDINTPLAHLGTPVCIGPMLGHGEEREARKLITLPFFMLGYRFDPPDLPNRILGLTNYYPSLIQLFGWHLLEHLTDKNKAHFDARESPPYLIEARHIDEAYQRQELREAIIDRFKWTLHLDPRYRVIALQIALESLVRRQQGMLYEGFEVEWIRNETLSLWPQGFKDKTYEAFRTLLDEMIGLGVLRKAGHLYDLRSPNVINLLGTKEEIEEALLDAAEEQPPLVYEAASFRRALPTDHWQRSPLTWQQESELFAPQNGVAILFGAPIAGLSDVKPFLERAAQSSEWAFEVLDKAMSPEEFQSRLEDSWQQHHTQSKLMFISLATQWNEKWVSEAIQGIQRFSEMNGSSTGHFRVLFIGSCQEAWAWVNAGIDTRQALNSLTRYSLQPWQETAVRHWMNDAGFGHDAPDSRQRFDEVTGNWGQLLHEMGSKNKHAPNRWKEHLDELEEQINQSPEKWLPQLELVTEAKPVLMKMAEYSEPMSIEDMAELSEQSEELVQKVIEWADLLSLVKQDKRDTWVLDKMISRLVIG